MASLPFSGVSASDLLRGSCSGVMGVPLRSLGRSRIGAGIRRRETVAMAAPKIKKGKRNHEYPWPKNADEIDPNVKGGYSSYLSDFKPLKERPKPVTLPFEKPLLDLEKKITDVRKMANETGLDFSDQIISLEAKYQQAVKDLYTHLTPIQRVSIARHPNRPTFLDHVLNITEKWVELHGDRAGYDDPAIVTGIGSINGRSYMFIGQQKGRNTKENIKRNFGMPTPHGYRKALRMMYYADHHKLPIITFVDTPGAFADLKSEELGQGEAIAFNLRTMFSLKVPIVSIIIGEGGSGGALAIACANKLLMLENSVFYVASPEACAAILWKSAKASPKAAEKLKITATELCKLKIADGIIPEPLGGAHADPSWTSQQIKLAVVESMNELMEMDIPELLNHRMLKFRNLGGFAEDKNLDPSKKRNMKKRDIPVIRKEKLDAIPELALDQVEKMKQQILNSKRDPSSTSPDSDLNKMLEILKKEIDKEFAEVAKTMGLKDRLEILRKEFIKAKGSQNQLTDPGLLDEIEKLKEEFKQGLSNYPNLSSLNYKLDTLKEISQAKKISEENGKIISLKQEINKRFKDIMDRDDVKEKIDMLKTEISDAKVSKVSDIDDELKEKIVNVKKEIETELSKALNSLNLDVTKLVSKAKTELPISSDIKDQVAELNHKIKEKIEDAINSSDLKRKVELLKLEVAKSGETHDAEAKRKIKAMKQEIKQSLAKAVNLPSIVERYEKIKKDIAKGLTSSSDEQEGASSGRSNGSLNHGAHGEGDQNSDTSNIEIDIAAKKS